MKLYDIRGKARNRTVTKYLIDWDGKSRSKLQFNAKQFFKTYWQNHVVYEEFPVYGTRMKVDIVNATKKIAVEVNGEQHDNFNKFFHGDSRAKYLQSIKRDVQKANWLEQNNFLIIYIYKKDIPLLSVEFLKKAHGVSIV